MKKKELSLSLTLTFIIVAVFAISTIVSTVFIDEIIKSEIKQNSEIECYSVTQSYGEALSAKALQYVGQLSGYVNAEEIKSADLDAITKWLPENIGLRPSDSQYVAYVSLDGTLVSDSGSRSEVKDSDYYKAITGKNFKEYVSTSIESKITGRHSVYVCKAVTINGKTNGFIADVVNSDVFQSAIKNFTVFDGKAIITCGDDFIASSDNRRDGYELLKAYTVIEETDYGNWIKIDETGEEFFMTQQKIEGSKWILNYLAPKASILSMGKKLTFMQMETSLLLGIILIIIIILFTTSALRPLKTVSNTISEIATGNADLTQRIKLKNDSKNEIGKVVDGFNTFTDKLQMIIRAMKDSKEALSTTGEELLFSTEETSLAITKIIENIENVGGTVSEQTNSVEETASTIDQISSNITALNKMVEEQSETVTQASAAVEEMISNIHSVNNTVSLMSNAFNLLNQKSEDGMNKQNIVFEMIKEVESESMILLDANKVIADVAAQTNLLAMNAAIEAAHAGEAGKGFSVVADEIRTLSENSNKQTKTIGNQLKKITNTISTIVKSSQEAQIALTKVSDGIEQTDSLVQGITQAMQEQEIGSKQITEALKLMNDSTFEVSNASLQMSNGTKTIIDEVQLLQNNSQSIKDAINEMSNGAALITTAGQNLKRLTVLVDNSITDIGSQVDKFTV